MPRDDVRQWGFPAGINVVLFAGMGGACQGLEAAGFPVHVAVNHDAVAIAAHRALNPHTRHLHADIYEVDPVEATGGRPVAILWGSPDCRDHSVAKGGAPRSPRVRSMPWQMCRWVGTLRKRGLGPDVVFLENVREIRGWGPLVAKRDAATGRVLKVDGTVAAPGERVPVRDQQLVRDPRHAGRIYRAWVRHMEALGAVYEDRDLNCADYGIPTSRKRLFGIAHFDGRRPVWPQPTHAPRDKARAAKLRPWRAAAEIIDWSLPLPSIFDRKKPLAPATLRRVAVGMFRFVIEAKRPFLVSTTHHGGPRVHDGGEPLPTVTTAHRGEMAVAAPVVAKWRENSPGADPRDPLPTVTANGQPARPAGAIPLGVMAASLVSIDHQSAAGVADLSDPLATSTAKARHTLVAAHMVQAGYGERPGQDPRALDVEAPIGTIVAGGTKHAVVGAVLAPSILSNNENNVGAAVDGPVPTVTTGNRNFVVAAHLAEHRGGSVGQPAGEPLGTQTQAPHHAVVAASLIGVAHGDDARSGSRAYDLGEPAKTVTQSNDQALVAAWLAKHNGGVIGNAAADPLSTVVTTEGPLAVAGAYLAQLRGTGTARDAGEPLPTQTADGHHEAVTAAFLAKYYGSEGNFQTPADPIATISTKDRFGIVAVDQVAPPLTDAQLARARQVADFLRGQGAWPGGDVVTVGPWIVLDIGMRMLTPTEAAAAHELTMPVEIEIYGRRRPLTKSEAMRLVGNSVPQQMAQVLARANVAPALTLAAE